MSFRVSTAVQEHLGWAWAGRVHSIFDHSLNVEVDGLLLNIGVVPERMPALGLVLPEAEGKTILADSDIGDLVRSSGLKLSIYPTRGLPLVCRWEEIEPITLAIPQGQLDANEIGKLADVINGMEIEHRLGIEVDEHLESRLQMLIDPQLGNDCRRQALIWLLGRGKGLTPSGDDIVAGYAYVMWTCGVQIVDPQVRVAARMRTTAVSATMLHMLSFGEVGMVGQELWQSIRSGDRSRIEGALDQELRIGSTSGADTIFGMSLAIRRLKEALLTKDR